ncbi:hypothetical protein BC834DRAFT_879127 [Gloeopeniophorella convolvens]|nr:hypothetical protein BC834DRAFT_879127 [Gloeopeniophorella convolvens]
MCSEVLDNSQGPFSALRMTDGVKQYQRTVPDLEVGLPPLSYARQRIWHSASASPCELPMQHLHWRSRFPMKAGFLASQRPLIADAAIAWEDIGGCRGSLLGSGNRRMTEWRYQVNRGVRVGLGDSFLGGTAPQPDGVDIACQCQPAVRFQSRPEETLFPSQLACIQ